MVSNPLNSERTSFEDSAWESTPPPLCMSSCFSMWIMDCCTPLQICVRFREEVITWVGGSNHNLMVEVAQVSYPFTWTHIPQRDLLHQWSWFFLQIRCVFNVCWWKSAQRKTAALGILLQYPFPLSMCPFLFCFFFTAWRLPSPVNGVLFIIISALSCTGLTYSFAPSLERSVNCALQEKGSGSR